MTGKEESFGLGFGGLLPQLDDSIALDPRGGRNAATRAGWREAAHLTTPRSDRHEGKNQKTDTSSVLAAFLIL